ncbi:MAG: BrnT family toxin [Bryobacteraceae bacterium]|nr:BrnT family toxin [Bryobacteraceae bacterium]
MGCSQGEVNRKKHGVSFEQATAVSLDPFAATYPDPDHSAAERREITLGHTIEGRLIFVAHCQRGNRVRIISERPATTRERHQYEATTR